MRQARLQDRKYLTASDDPTPIVIIDWHSSFWRSGDRRENKPFFKLLESASLGERCDPRKSRNKDKKGDGVYEPVSCLAGSKIQLRSERLARGGQTGH